MKLFWTLTLAACIASGVFALKVFMPAAKVNPLPTFALSIVGFWSAWALALSSNGPWWVLVVAAYCSFWGSIIVGV